jgi:GTPase SAR1 family protein
MTPMYYRGAHAALLVCDMTNEASFHNLKELVNELNHNLASPPILAIACNKSDLSSHRAVSHALVLEYAQSIGAVVRETSAKNNDGIDELFTEIARQLVDVRTRPPQQAPPRIRSDIGTQLRKVSVNLGEAKSNLRKNRPSWC